MIRLIKNANNYLKRRAIISDGADYSYKNLLDASEIIALHLLNSTKDLNEARIAFIVQPGFDYVSIQWGIWRAGGIAVPLCISHPIASIKYVIEDSQVSTIVFSREYETLISPLHGNPELRFFCIEEFNSKSGILPIIDDNRRAMIIYTSGTTGSPKGVVSTHHNIEAQITSLIVAWEWNQNDHILNVLPMHHVHGIVNVLCCALWIGACCEFLDKFNPEKTFNIFCKNEVNIFMAVPTIYFKLISYYNELPGDAQQKISESLKRFRLMVSGSAALPISIFEKWKQISGHTLLERYGMTEIGMAISNPYKGERKAGYIGQPLPDVQIRLVDENDLGVYEGDPGEIQIKGTNVFKEYWGKPTETLESFTKDGWFKTGDISIFENGSYKILGRDSVDIIKSGGYKISALEIEEVLRLHPQIKDCAVVGLPDEEWGEIIAAGLVVSDKELNLIELTEWLKNKLPNYKTPRKYIILDDLPRNVMGKVTKTELVSLFNTERYKE